MMRTRLSAANVIPQFVGTRRRIAAGVRWFVMAAAFALAAGCGTGGVHGASLPAVQSAPGASAMNAYPQSQSPASFKVATMQQTQPLAASALPDALRGVAPQTIEPLNYSKLSGSAVSVAGAPDGSLWALSPSPAGVNKEIWHYVSGTWTNIPGAASSIAVGPTGTLYAVNGTSGGVYAYNGSSWSSLGGGARWVTAGADGAVYVLSNAHVVNGNSAIWKYASGTWTQQPGSGSELAGSFDPNTYSVAGVGAIAPDGYFVLNSSGAIYYYSPGGTGYVKFPGTASGIAEVIGGFIDLSYPALAGGEGLFYFDYGLASLTAEAGKGVSVATGAGSGGVGTELYVVNFGNAIYETPIVSPASKIYVANEGNATVTTYDMNGTQTAPTISTLGSPEGVAVDPSGKIYVLTGGNPGNVTIYTPGGQPTGVTFSTGADPLAVAVDAAGKIYVANLAGNSVTIYNAAGALLNTITTAMNLPDGVAVDASGKMYVTNRGNSSLTTYTASGTQTTPTIIGLSQPTGVAVGATGKIYITSLSSGTMQTYSANGMPTRLSITGLSNPIGVAVDGAGNIYIANDSGSVTTYDSNGIAGTTITTGLSAPYGVAVH